MSASFDFDYPILSGDSHFVEPPNLFVERVDKAYRDRAPRSAPGPKGGHYLVCEDIPPEYIYVSSWFAAGKKSEDLPQHFQKGWDAAPASLTDPAARLKEQDLDGVSAEVLYSTIGIYLFAIKDAGLVSACLRAFNDWAAEYCSHSPDRLLGVGVVILDDVDAAVAELQRVAHKGLKGIMIPTMPHEEHPYSDPMYDPFWAACQDMGVVISMHAAASRAGAILSQTTQAVRRYLGIANNIQASLGEMIIGGVFDRFPKLQVVSVEHDVLWFPHFIYRLTHGYERFRHLQGVELKHEPVEYLRRNVAATFQYEEGDIEFVRKAMGSESLLWSSDYPHNDSTWPNSRKVISDFAGGVPASELQKILGGNVARLYGLNLSGNGK